MYRCAYYILDMFNDGTITFNNDDNLGKYL